MTTDPALDPTPAAQVAQDVAAEPQSGPASPTPAPVQEQPPPAGTSPAENGQAAPIVNAAQSKIDQLQKAGFNQQEIGDWTTKTGGRLLAAGFNQDEVNNYLGIKYPDMAPIHAMVQNNLAANPDEQQSPDQEPPTFAANLDKGMGFPVSKVLAGADIGQETLPPAMRAHLMDCYAKGTANNFTDFMQCAVPAAANAVDPQQKTNTGMVAIQSLVRGALEGSREVGQAATPFKDRPADTSPKDYTGTLLNQSISQGYKNPDWYVAHLVNSLASSYPTIAMGTAGTLGGALAGSVIEPVGGQVPGGVVGGMAGFGAGGAMQTIAKSYQSARAEGLSHDASVNRALAETATSGAFSSLMGLAPELKVFGTTPQEIEGKIVQVIKKPVSEALLQVFGVQPAIGAANQVANAKIEGKKISADDLLTGYVTNAATGAGIVGAHAGFRSVVHPGVSEAVAPSVGKDPSAVTPEDVQQNVAKSTETSDAPHAQAFKDAGLVITGDSAKEDQAAAAMRTTYAATGVKPDQIVDDAKTNPEIAVDIESGKVPEAYSHLRDEEGRPVPPEGVRYTDLDPNSPEFADHKQIAKEAGFDLQPYPQGTEAIEHKDDINLSGPPASAGQPEEKSTVESIPEPQPEHAVIQHAPEASEFAEHAKAYPQTPEGMQQAAKDFVIKKGQETGNEHLVALNENGEATHYSEGSKNSVKIPTDLSKKLDDPNNKIVIHHNHPKPVGVGPTDISWLGKPGLEKIIAHTPEGQTSEASLNNQTKNALSWLKPKDRQEVLYKVGEKGFNKSRALISEYIKENDIEVGQDSPLTQVHNEIFNKAMAEAGVTDYNYSDDHSDVLPKTVYDDVLNKTIETIKEGLKEYDVKEQLPGQLGRPGGRSELPAGSETHANEHGNEPAVGEAGGAETTEPSATSGNADGSVEQLRERNPASPERSTLSPEHQDLEDKFGIPEDMNKSQLGKLNKKIEGIFSGKEQDGLPKSADLSDEQFEALEDYGRRVENAQAALPMSIKQEPAIFGPYTPEEVEQLRREDPDGFSDYVAARRALKQFYSGEKPDMDIRKAQQILSEGREKYGPAFGEAVPTSEPDPENLSKESESASINPLAHIFNPANQSEASRDMATALRQAKGPASHDTALIQEDLRPYAKDTAKLSPEQQMGLINYMENRSKGAEISDPKLQKLADLIRDIYSKMAAKVQETFPDVGLREDYFTHQYKDEDAARKFFSDFVAAQGSERNLRERVFPTLSDAIAAGLEPKTTNPIETVMTYVSNMNNLIAANRAVELAQDFGVADYFKKGQQPDGWVPLNGNLSDKNGKTLYAPEDAARVYNNDISEKASGPVGKILDVIQQTTNFANKLVLGLSGYHFTATTMATMSSDMGRALTGGTLAERAGDVGKAAIAPISSVLRGSRAINAYLGRDSLSPEMQRSLDLAIKNNAIAVKQQDYWKAGPAKDFVDAFRAGTLLTDAKGVVENIKEHPVTGPIKAIIDGVGSTMDTVSKPLFDVYIPRIKNAALLDEIHDWLQKNPDADEKTTDRAVQDIGNSIDNRFGEMMRDNLFWHQYLRQTMQTLFLSYSWMTGAARMLKGIPDAGMAIVGKKGLTSNARYLMGMAVTYAVVNGVRNYIGTGQGPQSWKDLVFPQTGGKNPDGSPEREILPGHTGQFYNYLTEGIGELGNETSPLLKNTAELITNRDYRNLPITNDNNSWFTEQKWDDYYHHVLDQYTPIGFKNLEKGQKIGSNISTLESILGARAAGKRISNPEDYKEMMTKVNDREWKKKLSADKKAAAQYKEDDGNDKNN